MKEMIARVGDSINKNGIASVCLTGEELVRCKDCKHYMLPEGYSRGECMARPGYFPVDADWFCADGERRTDNA